MINPTPKLVADHILEQSDHVIELGPWMLEFLKVSGIPELQAFDLVDELEGHVANRLDSSIARAHERGVQPKFVWADASRTVLARPSALADEAVAASEARALRLRPLISAAIGTLSGSQFERVCDQLLATYGIPTSARGLTGRTGDGGFDFFGVLSPYPRPGSDRLLLLGRRFLGQAKLHFGHTVGPDEVEAFAGRLTNARLGNGPPAIPGWFLEHPQPLWGLFVTAGLLGPSARRAATRAGIYAIEGDQVAEDLSRSELADTWLDADGAFLESSFVESFAGNDP